MKKENCVDCLHSKFRRRVKSRTLKADKSTPEKRTTQADNPHTSVQYHYLPHSTAMAIEIFAALQLKHVARVVIRDVYGQNTSMLLVCKWCNHAETL